MPELPEVEVTLRGITKPLLHHRIKKVTLGTHKLRLPLDPKLATLEGAEIDSMQRRAKYIVIKTSQGSVILHLGMTGHLRVRDDFEGLLKHDHFAVTTEEGLSVVLNDMRRFGLVKFVAPGDDPLEDKVFQGMGPEPFSEDFNPRYLYQTLQKRSLAVKVALLDSKVVVGIGNIYASEVLFETGIDPRRRADSLTEDECGKLCLQIKDILQRSIQKGGTTIRDFSGADGKPGYFVQNLKVYGKPGEPCPACGTPIERIEQGQRHTFFCPVCQK